MNLWGNVGVICTAVIILLVSMVGCGKDKQETNPDSADEYIYVAEFQDMNNEGSFIQNFIFGKNDFMYFRENDKDGKFKLLSLKVGDESPVEIPLDLEEDVQLAGIGADADGNLHIALIKYKAPEMVEVDKAEIRKISTDGKIIDSIDVTGTFSKIPELYISNIVIDENGNYYVNVGQEVYVLKSTGEMIFQASPETYIQNMFLTKDGRVIIGYFINVGWKLEEVSLTQKALVNIDYSITFDYGTYQGGVETDLIYTQEAKLYTCDFTDEKPTEILNWIDSDISSESLQNFRILEDGRIVAFSTDYNTGLSELAILTKKNRSEVSEKMVLTYGTMYLAYFANRDIVAFNKQSDKYRIEVKQYGDDNTDYQTKKDLFIADISSGKGPDIIDLSFAPIALDEFEKLGILEDLNPYLDKDKEIKREDLVENALKTYEINGKLYSIMPNFGIMTLLGKVSDVGDGRTWTLDEMIELVDKQPENMEIISYFTKAIALRRICTMNIDEFINQETGECNFENDEFYKALDFANRFPAEREYDPNEPSEFAKIKSGDLLLSQTLFTSVQQYQLYEAMHNEDVNPIGFPTTGDSGSSLMANGTTVAISANSENKEGVWEFIRFNLMPDRQENIQSANGGFPMLNSALEKKFEDEMKTEYYEDVDGTQKETPKSYWSTGDFQVEVYAVTKEQVDAVRNMIDTAGYERTLDSEVFGIVEEEAAAYFEGQKTAQEVAEIIQSRAQIFVNENK